MGRDALSRSRSSGWAIASVKSNTGFPGSKVVCCNPMAPAVFQMGECGEQWRGETILDTLGAPGKAKAKST